MKASITVIRSQNKSLETQICCFWKVSFFCSCCAHSAVKSRMSLIFKKPLALHNPSYIPWIPYSTFEWFVILDDLMGFYIGGNLLRDCCCYRSEMRWIWRKKKHHFIFVLNYKMENNMNLSKCTSTESPHTTFRNWELFTSSGIDGALASTLNHDFNWKQLSEIILCIFLLMFSKFIWVTLIQKQQKYTIKRDIKFWTWASHFIMI